MKLFYSSGTMGYAGEGWLWHKLYDFPILPYVTKTITYKKKIGLPFAVLPIGNTVYNKVSLHNCGIESWMCDYYMKHQLKGCTVSIHGTDKEISIMANIINNCDDVEAIELNFSCPNVKDPMNLIVPKVDKPLYLKLNYKQDPLFYDLSNVEGIRLNSIPMRFCGGPGAVAKDKNWGFIKKYNKIGLNVAGCSFASMEDIGMLQDLGCSEVGIGSTILTNPCLIENIQGENYE